MSGADNGDCGQPFTSGSSPTATDALFILRGAVQLVECSPCECDLNGNGSITSADSLIDLRYVVGQPAQLHCPPCGTTSTSTTSTTGSSGCAPFSDLDGAVFNEKYTCIQRPTGGSFECVDQNTADKIRFHQVSEGNFQIRDEPDTGFVYTGHFIDCDTFLWAANHPDGYTEEGVWQFNGALTAFNGNSAYEANDESYSGLCNERGTEAPQVPTNPPNLTPCP